MESLNEIIAKVSKTRLAELLAKHTAVNNWTVRGYSLPSVSVHKKYGIVYRNAVKGQTIPWKDITITDNGDTVILTIPTVTEFHFFGDRLDLFLDDLFNLID